MSVFALTVLISYYWRRDPTTLPLFDQTLAVAGADLQATLIDTGLMSDAPPARCARALSGAWLRLAARSPSGPRVFADDAGDDRLPACARLGNAELIVSGDNHLLRFGSEYRGIRIGTRAGAGLTADISASARKITPPRTTSWAQVPATSRASAPSG